MHPNRASQVDAAVKKIGGTAKLYRGPGYWYFDGDDVEFAYSTSVPVCYLGQLTLQQWVESYQAIAQDHNERKP